MFDKKAIELSLNFIVILIISIIIFGFGIRFIYNLSSKAKDITDLTYDQLDQRMGDIICEGSERVCVGIDRKTIQKKDFGVFGVKIINVLSSQTFGIDITRPDPPGYKKNRDPIQQIDPRLVINPERRDIAIGQNEEKTIGFGVAVPSNAVSGTYIFNVNIMQDSTNYVQTQKLYVDVP